MRREITFLEPLLHFAASGKRILNSHSIARVAAIGHFLSLLQVAAILQPLDQYIWSMFVNISV
jgi:hypothetical protein